MYGLESKFLARVVINSARIMLFVFTPGYLLSIFRAATEDAAWGVIVIQSTLYLLTVLISLERVPFPTNIRILLLAGVALVVGLGGIVRNQQLFIGLAYGGLAAIYLSLLMPGLLRYVAPILLFSGMGLLAAWLEYHTIAAALSHVLGYSGIAVASIYLLSVIRQRTEEQAKIAEQSALNLEAESQRQRAVADLAQISFFEYDFGAGVMRGDKVLKDRYGVPSETETINILEFKDRFPPADLVVISSIIAEGASQQSGWRCSFQHQMRVGDEWRHFRVVGESVEREGHVVWVGCSIDITDEVRALNDSRIKNEQLEMVADAGKVAIFEIDMDAELISGSPLFFRRLGLDPAFAPVSLERFYQHIPAPERASFIEKLTELSSLPPGASVEFRHPFICSDENRIELQVAAVLEQRDERLLVQGSSTDITELASSVERAQQSTRALQEHQERQVHMYAVIGHELRTPAAALKMMLEDIKGEPERIDENLFSATVDQLLGVVDTLRSVAQPERLRDAAKDSVLLGDLLTAQLSILEPLARSHDVLLHSDIELMTEPVMLPAQQLKQLVSNLVKNAIIHSQGTDVTLGANMLIEEGQARLKVWIDDNGTGIAADKVEDIFSAYSRGASDAEGTGLGLFVSREIARALGGDLVYEAGTECGSRFILTATAALAAPSPQGAKKRNAMAGLRVLVAEDNPTIRLLTQRMLIKRGAEVRLASNGEEGLAALDGNTYDLILSDIFMPHLNGYEFVSAVRARGLNVPIVGLTAATIGEETERMLAVGADIVMAKPIDLDKLTAFLDAQVPA